MRIRVVNQLWFRQHCEPGSSVPVYEQPESGFWRDCNFISIRNSDEPDENCAVPISGSQVLKLQFDDAISDPDHTLILFDDAMAQQIAQFARQLDRARPLFVNCAAGISRSGAVGEVLNEYFNRYLEYRPGDLDFFRSRNRQLQGNPRVRGLLRRALMPETSYGDDR